MTRLKIKSIETELAYDNAISLKVVFSVPEDFTFLDMDRFYPVVCVKDAEEYKNLSAKLSLEDLRTVIDRVHNMTFQATAIGMDAFSGPDESGFMIYEQVFQNNKIVNACIEQLRDLDKRLPADTEEPYVALYEFRSILKSMNFFWD